MEAAGPPPAGDGPQAPARSGWSAGHVIGMIVASAGGLIGLGLLVGGLAIIGLYAFARDDDGFFVSDSVRLASSTYAITTEQIDLGADETEWVPRGVLGDVRLRVDGGRRAVFIGIGPDDEVRRWLAGVPHDQLVDVEGRTPDFLRLPGREAPAPPGRQDFWVARSEGRGDQSLTWDVEFGRWTAVVVNADASRGVAVEADVGVKIGWGIWVGVGLIVAGLALGAGAAVVIVIIGRHAASRGAGTRTRGAGA
jgi:hypothetical protein